MVAIPSSVSAARYGFQQAAAPQLKRAAEQAQQAADLLQAQARDAWQKVDSAQADARAVDARANQAISTAAQARQDLVSFGAGVLSSGMAAPSQSPAASAAPAASGSRSPASAPAVINTLGQRIGSMINITA